MQGIKSDKAEITCLVDVVFELIVKGLRSSEILRYVSEKHKDWNVTDRTVEEYIAKARKEFTKRSDYKRDQEISKSKARLELLFAQNQKIQDYKAALATQKELNELLGLYEPSERKHSGDIVIVVKRD